MRGYHYFQRFEAPEPEQILICNHERGNAFDRFVIKDCETGKEIPVGHLPKEISRGTKYLLDQDATATATLTSAHYRRSPLVQGDNEIPCRVSVTIPGTVNNLLILQKCKQLVEELYTEQKNKFFHI